MIVICMLFLSK